eukprot:TRINITY_DN20260_c0_g1_i11.p1 TRINITY_DN20260_c0_g1~~TRINITY_DN20260_c0_g1_i11.p1  ORF type:complete len:166 (+),score=23.94 TRINITY_DN20260_c0_g1_i11:509-1006(+)
MAATQLSTQQDEARSADHRLHPCPCPGAHLRDRHLGDGVHAIWHLLSDHLGSEPLGKRRIEHKPPWHHTASPGAPASSSDAKWPARVTAPAEPIHSSPAAARLCAKHVVGAEAVAAIQESVASSEAATAPSEAAASAAESPASGLWDERAAAIPTTMYTLSYPTT